MGAQQSRHNQTHIKYSLTTRLIPQRYMYKGIAVSQLHVHV